MLRKVYGLQPDDAANAIRALLAAANVEMNRPAVEAGLSALDAGGDFADGVIAYEENWLGGETFVSFDKKAVASHPTDPFENISITTGKCNTIIVCTIRWVKYDYIKPYSQRTGFHPCASAQNAGVGSG